MDGKDVTAGRTILVPAGETVTKTLQISQTNPDIYDYKDLQLRMSSTCDSNIEEILKLSAYFQQTSSDVSLKSAESAINWRLVLRCILPSAIMIRMLVV